MTNKTYKKVEVEWKDITYYTKHEKIEEIKNYDYKIFKTIGYLIEDTKDKIIIAFSISLQDEDTICDFYVIPKSSIVRQMPLK